ncbi:MAG: hypothetical protein AB7F40_00800 [Victivallaceae bacterium]|nr:hypothetical protein [Victivallaceae bacterium]
MTNHSEQLTGHVIVAARELEQLLRRAGSSALGIHDAVTELSGRLSEKCVKELRYIASVRNRVAHGEELEPDFDPAWFDAASADARRELEALCGGGSAEPVSGKIAEVDAEMRGAVRVFLRTLAKIPAIDGVYFAALAISGLRRAAAFLTALAFFLIGMSASVQGMIIGNRLLAGIGLGFLLLYWGQTAYLSWRHRAQFPELPRWLGLVPFLSAGYLAAAAVKTAVKAEFGAGIIPLAAMFVAVQLAYDRRWEPAAALLAAAWLWGLILLALRRKAAF